ncbi:ABC-type guanosine uptake system NupNOPQ [Commensalibacter communis]|uniref:ATPase component NupO (NupO) (PUBMED:21926227) n=1 Tax=Commensalibacter communis TaxID=2972786 RepID=A0A9W4X7M1_9PROT|nr:ABC transporter ATP-binding protein [Commensalibacter communis]CAI3955156.1 ABC-type guanosine uptake system NupNOPQ [Commensalibacter communis]CAI3955788.1 ABC-type guanosine uptake system NupNOPQ [Commensalibacter communis]CAI3957303.1 ABC-type guanosine uptake system NupNOPQ [Commensalibacter communis]CAI3958515.1 ABC-type guanosine uptake system NupNOPQ [Commensalibacter communis]CAI3958891.1 ABC-type guanosine uptake system NupNOPQ [Commensalibacter communis]
MTNHYEPTEKFVKSQVQLRPGDPPLIKFWKISKFFPQIIANNKIDLDIFPGEIHAIIGENGAGKSTLMNILSGIYQPDEGEIIVNGYGHHFASPQEAISIGIGMVHQHFKLVQAFTVAENIYFGEKTKRVFISQKMMRQRLEILFDQFGFYVNPDAIISDLSAGEQQRVEILRALSRKAQILILDEPTSVLTPKEIKQLFVSLSKFRQHGNAVIFITHKLEEVLQFSDTVSVLRHGQKIGTYKTEKCTAQFLANKMIENDRKSISSTLTKSKNLYQEQSPFIHLSNVSVKNSQKVTTLKNIDLDVYPGEILGIAGVVGNGQRELSQIITGMTKPSSGKIFLKNTEITKPHPKIFAKAGIGHIPEDRLKTALMSHLDISHNLLMRTYFKEPVGSSFFYSPRKAYQKALNMIKNSQIHIHDMSSQINNLSGGTQQKLVSYREKEITTSLLVAVYPSRGLDIGSITQMQEYFFKLREQNIAVLLFSEDLDEILTLSDRVGVLCNGELMGVMDANKITQEQLSLWIGGKKIDPLQSQ